jgi:hypothetical protein
VSSGSVAHEPTSTGNPPTPAVVAPSPPPAPPSLPEHAVAARPAPIAEQRIETRSGDTARHSMPEDTPDGHSSDAAYSG